MKFQEIFKGINKQYVYDVYQRLFDDDDVEYDRITRPKMFKRIIEFYSNPINIVNLCSKEEIHYLLSKLKSREKEEHITNEKELIKHLKKNYNGKHWLIKENLKNKMLVGYFGNDIPEEFNVAIKLAANLYKKKEYQDFNDDLCTLLGAMRVYALMSRNNFIKYFSLILGYDEEKMNKLLNTPRFKFYVDDFYDDGIEKLFYKDFDDDYYEIVERKEASGINIPAFLEADAYRDIFNYGFDLTQKYNRKFLNDIFLNYSFEHDVKDIIRIAMLNEDRSYFYDLRKNFGFSYVTNNKDIVDEIIDNYPSAVLLGNTIIKYNKLIEEIKQRNKNYSKSCKKQTNACIGDDEADQFYSVFFSLIAYLNDRYDVKPELQKYLELRRGIDPEEVIEVTDFFFTNPKRYVDEYLEDMGNLISKKHRKILEDFKRAKRGVFVLYNYIEQYAQFIDDDGIYQVKGIRCNIDEIIPKEDLPTFVVTNLLMYKGNIIYDGVISRTEMSIGDNMLLNIDKLANTLPKKYSLEEYDDSLNNEVEDYINSFVIKEGKTDMESSLKRLNEDILKEKLEEYDCEDVKELKEELISDFKMIFDITCKDKSTQDFFESLLENENSDNHVFMPNDFETFVVFLYENDDGRICYYIPDEIKRIIMNKLNKFN